MALKVFKYILILILVLGLKGTGSAREVVISKNPEPAPSLDASVKADEPKEETREKTLDGEIAGVSPNFIAIDYAQDDKAAYEMTFNITKDTRLERIKDIKTLKPGDTVWVSYNETVIKKGKEVWVKQRIVKLLRLLNAAKVEIEPAVEKVNEAEEEALEDEEKL